MRHEEFRDLVRELLHDAWGEKHFPPALATRLWTTVANLTASEFRAALENLSLTVNRAPTLGQINGACLPAIRKANERERDAKLDRLDEAGSKCRQCGNSGFVRALLRADPTLEYSFACPFCQAASMRGLKAFPVWRDDLKDQYAPIEATDGGYYTAHKVMAAAFAAEAAKNKAAREAERAAQRANGKWSDTPGKGNERVAACLASGNAPLVDETA